jgi:stage III sporulation protein SpoIIIAA
MLADDYEKRVMIVDTSNEIGGDGDIPHPGIGNARRLQVPNQEMQHKVCSLQNTLNVCSMHNFICL